MRKPVSREHFSREENLRYAMFLLDRRDYSKGELKRRLIERGVSADDAEYVVSLLEEKGILNDGRYARIIAERMLSKYGLLRVRAELFRRAIPEEISDEVISELETESSVLEETVKKLLAAAPKDGDSRKQRDKIYRKLLRMGFSSEDISSALSRLSEEDIYE